MRARKVFGSVLGWVVTFLGLNSAVAQPPQPPPPKPGQPLIEYRAHDGQSNPPLVPPLLLRDDVEITFVTFSPDSRLVASTNVAGWVELWDALNGQFCWKRRLIQNSPVFEVAFSANGRTLACGCDGEIVLLEVESGRRVGALKTGEPWRAHSVSFSPDGLRLAAAAGSSFFIWNAETGKRELTIACVGSDTGEKARVSDGAGNWKTVLIPNGQAERVAFSPDGKTLAGASVLRGRHPLATGDAIVCLYDSHTGKELKRFEGADYGSVRSLGFAPTGRSLATGYFSGLRVRTVAPGKNADIEVDGRSFHRFGPQAAFSPDGDLILVPGNGRDRPARICEANSLKEVQMLQNKSEHVERVAFSPDGRAVALACADHTIVLQPLVPLHGASPNFAIKEPAPLAQWWADLASSDPQSRYRAVWALAAKSREAVGLAKERMQEALKPKSAAQGIVRLFELINTREARELLQTLAEKSEADLVRTGAREALARAKARAALEPLTVAHEKPTSSRD